MGYSVLCVSWIAYVVCSMRGNWISHYIVLILHCCILDNDYLIIEVHITFENIPQRLMPDVQTVGEINMKNVCYAKTNLVTKNTYNCLMYNCRHTITKYKVIALFFCI